MLKKSEVDALSNKEWRQGEDLVGKRLNQPQTDALKLHQEQRWKDAQMGKFAVVEEKPQEMPEPREDIPCTADVANLGLRIRRKTVLVDIDTGEGRHGRVKNLQAQVKEIPVIQSLLTFEEAATLGTQTWRPFGKDGQQTCSVEGRRFIVEKEVFEELCQAVK